MGRNAFAQPEGFIELGDCPVSHRKEVNVRIHGKVIEVCPVLGVEPIGKFPGMAGVPTDDLDNPVTGKLKHMAKGMGDIS